MKNIMKIILPIALVLFLASVSFGQSSADKSWNSFYAKFSNAVKNKNKKTIKSMADSDFFDGGGGATVTVWMKTTLDRGNLWTYFYNALKQGAKNYDSGERKPWKITKNNEFLFVYKNGRWQFHGVMGD
jgi:hypothetical protein